MKIVKIADTEHLTVMKMHLPVAMRNLKIMDWKQTTRIRVLILGGKKKENCISKKELFF